MTKYNEQNERAKREYCQLLKHSKGKSEAMIDGVRAALKRWEEYTRHKDFGTFNKEQVIGFKENLMRQTAERTGKPLSKPTLLTIVNNLRGFFEWLAFHPDYRRKIEIHTTSYLNLSDNDKRSAKASKAVKFPSLEQIHKVVMSMPATTDMERRNRALVAFTILTGIRVNALVTLKLKHIDLANELVTQDPKEVHTKFSKLMETSFFPVGDDLKQIVVDWVNYLLKEKFYGYDAPLFPRTQMALDGNDGFVAVGIEPEHWKSTDPVRRIFREAFEAAGLPYYHPHSFRHTLGHLAYTLNLSGEVLKAWSQNLGHENLITTLVSYGSLTTHRQGELMRGIGKEKESTMSDVEALADAMMKRMKNNGAFSNDKPPFSV